MQGRRGPWKQQRWPYAFAPNNLLIMKSAADDLTFGVSLIQIWTEIKGLNLLEQKAILRA